MNRRHPEKVDLQTFLRGELPRRKNFKIAWHLLHCERCRLVVEESPSGGELIAELFSNLEPVSSGKGESPDYDTVISRTYGQLVSREASLSYERERAPQLYADLMRHPVTRQKVLVQNLRRFQSWALAEHLLGVCVEAWFDRPNLAEDLAELALAIVERLDPAAFGDGLLNDLKCRCWAHIANSRRICNDLRGADEAIVLARELLDDGTQDPVENALLCGTEGSLRFAQRDWPRAEKLFTKSIEICQSVGDDHSAGKWMVSLGNVYAVQGRIDEAIETLTGAVSLVDLQRDSRLALGTRHNLIDYLSRAGRFMEAHSLLAKSRDLYERFGDPSIRRRLTWTRGRVAQGLGQYDRAEDHYRAAREAYIELGHGLTAAVVSLELASMFAEQGRTGELKSLAAEILPIFQAMKIGSEVLAALLLLKKAADAEQVTTVLVRELSGRVQAAADKAR